MSEEKVLTMRGKKAVWAPAPAGVGGNDREFIIDAHMNSGEGSITGSATFAEAINAVGQGKVPVLYLTTTGMGIGNVAFKSFGAVPTAGMIAFAFWIDFNQLIIVLDESGFRREEG